MLNPTLSELNLYQGILKGYHDGSFSQISIKQLNEKDWCFNENAHFFNRFINGYPVGSFIINEKNGKKVIVDGYKRIKAMHQFIFEGQHGYDLKEKRVIALPKTLSCDVIPISGFVSTYEYLAHKERLNQYISEIDKIASSLLNRVVPVYSYRNLSEEDEKKARKLAHI